MHTKSKIIRTATIPLSLNLLLNGQLSYLNQFYNVIAVSSFDEHLNELKEREGIKVASVEMQRQISPIKDLKSLWQLYRLFRAEKPEIVHSMTPKAGLLSMLAAKFAGVPVRIHTFTGLIFPSKSGNMQKLLIKMDQLLCWAATNIIPEGEGVKRDLIKFKITQKPLDIIANGNVNGINLDYYNRNHFSEEFNLKTKNDLNINEADFVFVFVGRMVKDKGINELVEAFVKLQNTGVKNVKLLLVGPFENEHDPISANTKLEIENNRSIISTGFQKDVRPYFSISNAFVLPSYREGFPNAVLQAGAMELPSIVTDINGSNEIINNGLNGLIIPSKDSNALFDAMFLLINNKEHYFHLKSNARNLIANRYEQTIVWKALLQKYNSLLKS